MPDSYHLQNFTKHSEDLDAADSADPNFATGYQGTWLHENANGTWTIVESNWGVRCSDWDGRSPLAPYTPSHMIGVLVCADPADPGSTEISADYFYFDGEPDDYTNADAAARRHHDDEMKSATLTGMTGPAVTAIASAVTA